MRRLLLLGLSLAALGTAVLFSQLVAKDPPLPPSQPAIRAIGALQSRLSPQGQKIAFSYQGSIWVMPSAGGTMTRLTTGDGFDIEPAWSSDGSRIAYLKSRNNDAGPIQMVKAEDGSTINLPTTVQARGKLAFHPDGRRLLASCRTPDLKGGEGLAWLDLTTGKATSLLDPPQPARRSALSADGRWVAFATHLDVPGQQSGNDGPQADLWKVSADGGKPEKIVRFPSRVHDLCWSADGRSLILTTDLGGAHYDLWQVPLVDSLRGAHRLTSGQADEDRPSLSQDGRYLLYTDNREGPTALILRDLRNGGEQTLVVNRLDYRAPEGTIRLQISDKATNTPTVARITLVNRAGKFFAPPGALYRLDRGLGHFYGRDTVEFRLPADDYELRLWRGPEYRPERIPLSVVADKRITVPAPLMRLVDAASQKLHSGENHIHANYGYGEWYNTPETMLLQCEGEDLNVCNFVVANSDGDGVFDRPFFRGHPDPLSKPRTILSWNEEYRSTLWGHMTLVHLSRLSEPIFTGFKDTTNPWDVPTNADTAQRVRQQGGLVNYTHVAFDPADPYQGAYTGKGLPVDAALGKIDTMDLNNSYGASVPLWYRLLNCGFRISASAGTDCFLNRVASNLPGSSRAYVRIDGEFTYASWIDGLRAGRSFVTNGPFLELTVAGQRPGGTVRLAAPGKVKVVADVWSRFPLQRAELVQDGKVVGEQTPRATPRPSMVPSWEQEVQFERSGWLALRTSGPAHADNPGGPAYSHTSPVYVEVAGRPASAREDAQFFLKWIDRLDVALRERNRIPTAEDKAHVAAQLEAARQVYTRLTGRP